MTVLEAFEQYRRDRIVFANLSPKTEEAYVCACKCLLSFLGKDIPLVAINFETVRSWKAWMDKRMVNGTSRGYLLSLRSVLRYARKLDIPCLDPDTIPVPKRTQKAPIVLTPQEIRDILRIIDATAYCSKLTKARNKAIICLLYSSGIRVAEMCRLNVSDVQGEVFTVYGKGGKSRPAMIDGRARKAIDLYLSLRSDSHEALFIEHNQRNARLTPNSVQAQFRRISKKFGKPIHPHTLRHSFATDLMRKGCHIYPLSRMMGHSSIATTQIYLQVHDQELLEAHRKYHTI